MKITYTRGLMENLRNKSIEFIYKIFAKDCKDTENLKFESEYFNSVVNNFYNDLIIDKEPVEKPFMVRTAGQSGSGKTTQLLPSIKEGLPTNNYVHLAVRKFAKLHPNYNKLLQEFGDGLIREKTNGFALLCLFKSLELLIKNKYNVLFEVTILDPDFEEYVNRLAKFYNYFLIFNVLSVPFEVSNYFANKRMKESKIEKNRIVPQKTLDFFYEILPLGIERIINISSIFDKNDYFIMWNIISCENILVTNNFNKNILNLFNKNRIISGELEVYLIENIEKKLEEKKKFYREFFKNNKN